MKNLIIILLLLTSTIVVAQEKRYDLYNCYQVGARTKSDNGAWSTWDNQDAQMILRMCIEENKIEFNTKNKAVFYFIEFVSESKVLVDDDGDKYTVKEWKGYDEDGLRCTLVIIDWPDLPNRNFKLKYSDAELSFSCKLITK